MALDPIDTNLIETLLAGYKKPEDIIAKNGLLKLLTNAACESFMKTLKYEEVYRTEYRDITEAYSGIGEFIERVYNTERLHSALGDVPPAKFEHDIGAMQ